MAYDVAKANIAMATTITFDGVAIVGAYGTGDIGGTPSGVDVSVLSGTVKLEKSGPQEIGQFEVNYRVTTEDETALRAKIGASSAASLVIQLQNGDTYTNSAVLTACIVEGLNFGDVVNGKAVFNLANPNGWTYSAHS